jgi:soluble lytic murein transglycosylase
MSRTVSRQPAALVALFLASLLPSARAAPPDAIEALSRAGEAMRRGRYAECAAVAAAAPVGAAHLVFARDWLAAQCRFYAGETAAARAAFARLARQAADPGERALAALRAADCSARLGDVERAAREYREALAAPASPLADRAVAVRFLLEHEMRAGREARVRERWLELGRQHADHPLWRARPESFLPPALSMSEAMALARSAYRARDWEGALLFLDSAPDPRGAREAFDLAYLTGRILFDMPGRKAEAARFFLGARDHAPTAEDAEEAGFYYCRALTRLQRTGESILCHQELARRFPRGKRAANALFFAGWLEADRGRCGAARGLFERVMQEHARTSYARDAAWNLALCDIREERNAEAARALADAARTAGGAAADRIRYWWGLSLIAAGEEEPGRAVLAGLAGDNPLSWYGHLALMRLGLPLPQGPGPAPAARADPREPLLTEAGDLGRAGLNALAAARLDRGRATFLRRHPGVNGALALAKAYRAAGDDHAAWKLTAQFASLLRGLPRPGTAELWRLAYPRPFAKLVAGEAATRPELEDFLYAIMRSESGFDPMALSWADARGLMQLTPGTGRRVAAHLGLDPAQIDLYHPPTNIRLAATLLSALAEAFRGQWPLVAAAYNAGELPVLAWVRSHRNGRLDRFVEDIPYAETRAYVKTVWEAFLRYRYLAGRDAPALPAELDPSPKPLEW